MNPHAPHFKKYALIDSNGSFQYDLSCLGDFYYASALASCMQDPTYHKEGDVWRHTQMALEALLALPQWKDLEEKRKFVLFMAVLLHDIGKLKTTRTEEGRITSPHHARAGKKMARAFLWDNRNPAFYHVPWEWREQICSLVLLHMLPARLLDKPDPFFSIVRSSWTTLNEDLYLVALADESGRICSDPSSKDAIELFRSFCMENECFDKAKAFQSGNARFRYFFEKRGHPSIDWFEPAKGRVVMMSGLQGAGKDYTIKQRYQDWMPVFGVDAIREERGLVYGDDEKNVALELKERMVGCLREGKSFVLNATNLFRELRGHWIQLFRNYHFSTDIVYVERPLPVILEQNASRDRKVPEHIIEENFIEMDIPDFTECLNCHEVIS